MSAELTRRASGVLLHPTSLPGPAGIGDVGAASHRFLDWLAEAGQSYWQLLPLVAVDESGSPYNGLSAMAGNPLLIDLAALADHGLLEPGGEVGPPDLPVDRVDYAGVTRWKGERLRHAHTAFLRGAAPHLQPGFEEFRAREAAWLDDYALFRALRSHYRGAPWTEWEPAVRDRDPAALSRWTERLQEDVESHIFQQYLFDLQWAEVRRRAGQLGIELIGDIPIFVAHDSADVWANRELFLLEPDGSPRVVSGVPPDYFSETGQRWGNPLYDWRRIHELEYPWWTERFRRTLEWVDLVRIDHFRGFEAYWEIPAEEETALRGHWVKGPGRELFDAVARRLGRLPVVAEDLGLITPEVEALRDELGYPGMRVLQFAFDGEPDNPHLPENYVENVLAYTGTHDNDTVLGWWSGVEGRERERAVRTLGREPADPVWAFLEVVFASRARLVIATMQDLLGLGSESRMNRPGSAGPNWSWRMPPGEPTPALARRLREMAARHGRLPGGAAPDPHSTAGAAR